MAGTARTITGFAGGPNADDLVTALKEEHNKVITDLATLRTVLGLQAGYLTSAPGIAIGSVSKKEILTAAFTVVQNGEARTVASAETAFTATTHDIADPDANPREAYYTLSLKNDDTITITKDADAAEDAAVKGPGVLGELVIGHVKIQHNGTAIFDATTDDLDAAHLTVTYEDAQDLGASDLTAATIATVLG
jgi:hypothetical protein